MGLSGAKGLFASRTVWGGVVALLPIIGKVLEQAGVVPPGTVDEVLTLVTSTAGGILAIYGRLKATSKIGGLL